MSAHIGNLKDENGNIFYPITKTNAVLDNNNVDVETRLNNLENNKVDKTSSSSRLYGTSTSGGQTTLTYSSGNQDASTIPLRDANGDIRMNALYSNNGKIYTKNFYNYSSDQRYCHIGVLKAEYSNQTFAGKIYTSQGYEDTDSQQEFIDFTVTINNNKHLGGFATCVYNNPPSQDECQILFVPTSNSWEWDMLLKMHSWTNALVELKMSAPNASGFKFTFDSSDANFVSQPSSTELTITPRRLSELHTYYVRFESGLQICWGRVTNAGNNASRSYPIAFASNTSVYVYITQRDITNDWNNNLKAINISTTSFGVNSGGTTNFDWIAIGRWR